MMATVIRAAVKTNSSTIQIRRREGYVRRSFYYRMPLSDGLQDNDNNNNGNSKDSGSGSGGGGGNNNNNSGNSQSCGSGVVPFFGHACSYINDNDPRLKYSNGWKLESGDPNGHTTIHTTTQTSATVGFSFNGEYFSPLSLTEGHSMIAGSWIGVFGTISPGSNPPTANYTLDKGTPDPIRETPVQKCFTGQPLFSTPPGLPLGSHNLTIEVVKVDDDTPYILDQIVVCSIPPPPPNHSQQSTSTFASTSTTTAVSVNQSAPADTERTGVRPIDGIIIGSVLGAVFLLIAIGLLVWWLIQRRRKRLARLRCLHIAASPVSSWIFRQNSREYFPEQYLSY